MHIKPSQRNELISEDDDDDDDDELIQTRGNRVD